MQALSPKYFLMLAALFLFLLPQALPAQNDMGKTNAITGCLQKGSEAGGFTLTGDDGKVWELKGKVDAAHVGHKVTVKGHELQRSQAEEAKAAPNEKQESDGKPYGDFQVSSLKMVSSTCQ